MTFSQVFGRVFFCPHFSTTISGECFLYRSYHDFNILACRLDIFNIICWINFHFFRLAVHNMHYVSNVLGIRDPIHKQKIALKAMDVVLFGPPRGKHCGFIGIYFKRFPQRMTFFFYITRNWNTLERLYTRGIIIKCNYWLLVRLSTK